jgi:hypothetical protein
MTTTGNALRQRRIRQRKRAGLCVLQVVVSEHRFVTALLRSNALGEDASRRRALVEREASRVLDAWARRWTKE